MPLHHILPAVAALSLISLSLSSCNRGALDAVNPAATTGSASVTVYVGQVGSIAKQAAIDLATLTLTLTAEDEESISRTFALDGSGRTSIQCELPDLAAKLWTISATTLDNNGVTVHSQQSEFDIDPGQQTRVTINMDALYSILIAAFRNLPVGDSIYRCALLVDGAVVSDSIFSPSDLASQTLQLSYDYLTTGQQHEITLEAYGNRCGHQLKLYAGSTTVPIVAGLDTSYNVILNWVGPCECIGAASIEVSIGSIGTVAVNGEFAPPPCVVCADQCIRVADAHTAALWRLNEMTGTSYADISPNANNGTVFGPLWATGICNGALSFNGTTDYCLAPASPSLNVRSITIEAMVYPTDGNTPMPIVEYADPTGFAGTHIQINTRGWDGSVPGALQLNLRTNNPFPEVSQVVSDGGFVKPNMWNQIAITYDCPSGLVRMYHNGVIIKEDYIAANSTIKTGHPVYLGLRPAGSYDSMRGRHFKGMLDDVEISNIARTPDEMAAHWAAYQSSLQ